MSPLHLSSYRLAWTADGLQGRHHEFFVLQRTLVPGSSTDNLHHLTVGTSRYPLPPSHMFFHLGGDGN